MKVNMPKNYKRIMTADDITMAKILINDLKDDECKVEDYCVMAVNVLKQYKTYEIDVLKASAEICRNYRTWKALSYYSEDFDVYIKFIAMVDDKEFVKASFYISDIYQLDGDNNNEIKSRINVRTFKEMS